MKLVDLLIKDGLVVTMDDNRRIFKRGSVAIEDKKIVAVGKSKCGDKPDEIIDARGKIVMPGLFCSHAHVHRVLLYCAPMKIEPPANYLQSLQRIWWPMDEATTKRDAYAATLISCLNFIKTGTTFFSDTYSGSGTVAGTLDYIASAIEESGIRGLISLESTERRTHAQGARGMRENLRFIKKVRKKGRGQVAGMVSVHAPFTASDELLRYAKTIASRYKVPITIQVSEGLVDLYHNLEHYGKRPVERLHEVGLLGKDTVLAHCVHLDDEELALIKDAGAKVAHVPISDMLNGLGVAPIQKMQIMDIPVGLGSDGYPIDGFENLRITLLLHRVAHGGPRLIDEADVLEMATIRGAELYGLEKELGSLEEGKFGDVIIVDPSRAPTLLRPENAIKYIVNFARGSDVRTVIVGGRIIMRDRKVLTLDEEEVIKMSRARAKKLWQKLEIIRR
ncbi:MAG: amidohydrolase [Hadesarchaea archaeon]|nr:amidohydrolase [Hadesarchaea archaeon]